MNIGDRVKIIRTEFLHLKVGEFANAVGSSKSAISEIENGKRGVTNQMAKLICSEFNVNEDWLRNGEGDMFVPIEDEVAAIVADVLDKGRNDPLYDIILSTIKIYQELDPASKDAFKLTMMNLKKGFESNK